MLAPTVVTVSVAGGVSSNMHTCLTTTATLATISQRAAPPSAPAPAPTPAEESEPQPELGAAAVVAAAAQVSSTTTNQL